MVCESDAEVVPLDKFKLCEVVEDSIRLQKEGQTAGESFSDIKLASFCLTTVQRHVDFGNQRPAQDNQKDQGN